LNVKIDGLADLVSEYMSEYSKEVTNGIKKAVDVVAKEANQEIKAHIPFNQPTGKYVKSFRIKNVYEDGYRKINVWYVGNDQYGLTHLLENGHALRQGGRAKAFPHIKYGEELAKKRMEELAKEAIENAGR
jgi:hypothetical protein